MSNHDKKNEARQILDELRSGEETENQLIWIYQTLLDLGIENCFSGDHSQFFKEGMEKLYNDSVGHKLLIQKIINKYI